MAAVNTESSTTLLEASAVPEPTSLKSKFEKRLTSEISFKDFLDFLRTAYQINEAIEGVPNDLIDKVEIDWQDIAMNEFVSSLVTVKDGNTVIPKTILKVNNQNKSLSHQSKSVTELSDLNKCDDKNLDTGKKISSYSDISELAAEDESCNDVEEKNKMVFVVKKVSDEACKEQSSKEVVVLDAGKNSNSTRAALLKNKLQMSIKTLENKKKLLNSNKKDILVDSKVKKQNEDSKNFELLMKRKLNEVIQEGLLDSVLPYVVPKQSSAHPPARKSNLDKKQPSVVSLDKAASGQLSKEKININNRRKSSTGEIEVEIHVCDEVKNMKRDFRCPQKLLVSKMGYFAEVTTGQKLEDMDISVHCDITIFDWLMRWVKKDPLPEESWPKLDAGNVVPILVSAAFLQMDPLLQDCLTFCRKHMNEIAKTSTNLACLNDSILTRLANLFSNSEVEDLRDKKDKIQSRLYCKLILALTETSPEPARGHFASLANVYKCGKCEKLIIRQLSSNIPCKSSNMKMDRFGKIHGNHIRDPNWNLNDYIRSLRQELKSWRNVYWRLWGDCHFLFCSFCQNYFPANQMQWCCHHPEPAQFFTMEHQRTMTFPIGRHPCCGERAYRFEVLSNQSGCQFKEHTPVLQLPGDTELHKLFLKYQSIIMLEPRKVQFPQRLTRLVSGRESGKGESVNREVLWWDGIELAPPRPRQGLLAKMWETHQKKEQQKFAAVVSRQHTSSASSITSSVVGRPVVTGGRPPMRKQMSIAEETSTSSNGNRDADNSSSNEDSSSNSSSSESEDNSEESGRAPVRRVTAKPRNSEGQQYYTPNRNRQIISSHWVQNLSVRSNQDNQREFEERAVRQMAALLTRRTCADSSLYARTHNRSHGHHGHSIWNNHIIPQGGIYVRLEHEWREANCQSHACHANSNRLRNSGWGISSRPKVRPPR